MDSDDALQQGLKDKAREFIAAGSKLYQEPEK